MGLTEQLVGHYGYLAVGVGVGVESIGVPLPGETILIAAATYAGATGHLRPAVVVAVAAVAAILGDNIGYWIGHRYGIRVLGRAARSAHLAKHLPAVVRLFDRYGSAVVLAGRFVSVVRTYAAFGAGATGMRWRRFLTLNTVGGTGWAASVGFTAAALGAQFGTTLSYALTAAGLAAAAAATLALRARRRHVQHRPRRPTPLPRNLPSSHPPTLALAEHRGRRHAPLIDELRRTPTVTRVTGPAAVAAATVCRSS